MVEWQLPKLYMAVRFRSPALIAALAAIFFSGCASAPPVVPKPLVTVRTAGPGQYHKVAKGETLWQISKHYGMELEELARVNHISDTTTIEPGQLILIPMSVPVISRPSAMPQNEDFAWPLRGRVISLFGATAAGMRNDGINIQPSGDKSVVASRSGRVVFCDPGFYSWGKVVIIDHGDGYSSVYARNADVFVKAGDMVQRGARIALAGASGRDKAEYLHFEIRKGSVPQNPKFFLP